MVFVIFDYDGVIFDSVPAVTKAVDEFFVHIGLDAPGETEARRWLGPSIRDSLERVKKETNGEFDVDSASAWYFDALTEASKQRAAAFVGMEEFVQELATNVPVGIATMKAQTEIDQLDGHLPSLDDVQTYAAPADHHGGTSKKQLVSKVIAELDVDENDNGWMIGDRASDIDAGKAHGLTTVAVLWGGGTEDELRAANPEYVVATVAELRELLTGAVSR